MASRAELLWRQLPDVRARERSRFLYFAGLATLVSLAQTLGLAGSEALFLAEFGAAALPETFIAAALVTVLGSMAYAAVVGRTRNDNLMILMLVAAGVALSLAVVGVALGTPAVLPGLFCFFYLTQAVFVNHLWTFTGDYFDAVASKRLLPLFTVGASVGGFFGGLIAIGVTQFVNPLALVGAWGLLLLAAAVQLRIGRRRLRRWGPLDLEEADETSVEGIRGALRYLRTSILSRWLVLSAAGMMLALFVAQYLYSDIFARAFPTSSQLATFFGAYLAITNLVEIALEVRVTPWLIRRTGVATANLIHPVLTLLSFGGLAFQYGLAAGVAARVNRELVDNAVSQPVRNLLYNAMPMRFRGRMRAFLEGMVVYAGMAFAGLVLLALGDPDPVWLAAAGGATAVLYLFANWKARSAYVRTIVRQLRTGRLDLAEVSGEIGGWGAVRLAELWDDLLREEGDAPSRSLLQLVPALASHGITEPLVRETVHPNPVVRRSCVNALARVEGAAVEACLVRALEDSAASVRLAALRGLARRPDAAPRLAHRWPLLMADAAPEVRAEAAAQAGEDGLALLRKMADSEDPAEVTAALRAAPPALLESALGRARDPEPAVRAAALECVARVSIEPPLTLLEATPFLADPDAGVRRAAVILLANLDEPEAFEALAEALGDPSTEVQFAAETVLGSLGGEGVTAVRPHLRSPREHAAAGAMRVVATSQIEGSRRILADELRYRARQLWYALAACQQLPDAGDLPHRFLVAAFQDDMMRNRRLCFAILQALEDPSVIRKVEKALRFGSSRSRGDALEVLSNLGDRESAQLLVLLHERGSLSERIRAARRFMRMPSEAEEVLAAAGRSDSPWIQLAARAALAAERGSALPEEKLMERLLALKQVPLFAHLALEQLEAVYQITKQDEYLQGDVIMREGEPGGELYLLIDGEVEFYKDYGTLGQRRLGEPASAITYFGEMATLDDEPRSATVVATRRSQMLRLDGSSLKELILQMPEISFEIFRVLTARVRVAEAALSQR